MSHSLTGYIGIIGAVLLFIKFGIHIYIASLQKPDFLRGRESAIQKMELLFPIYYDASGKWVTVKKVGNMLYIISLIFLVIFLIGENIK